jgi:hypothetical protein
LPEDNYQVAVQAIDEFTVKTNKTVQFKYAPSLSGAVLIRTLPDGFTLVDINDTQLLALNQNSYLIDDLTQEFSNQRIVDIPININIWKDTHNKSNTSVSQNGSFSFSDSEYPTNLYLHDGTTLTNLSDLLPPVVNRNVGVFTKKHLIMDGLKSSYNIEGIILDVDTLAYEEYKYPVQHSGSDSDSSFNNDEWLCRSAEPLSRNGFYNQGYDVYIYQFGSGELTTNLTNNGTHYNTGGSSWGSRCKGIDSEYIAYTTTLENAVASSLSLYSLNSKTTLLLSSSVIGTVWATKSKYVDGLLAWQEVVANQNVLKIYDTATQLTVEIEEATFREVRFGKVSYTTDTGLFVWDKDNKTSHNIWPNSVSHYLSQSTNYIQSGQLIYRIDN